MITLFRIKSLRDISQEKDMDNLPVAESFDRYSRSFVLKTEHRLALNEMLKYRPVGLVLDAACGPGHLAVDIIRARPELKVLGVDSSEIMLRIATKNAADSGYQERISFCEGDVQELPVDSGSIDFIISTGSLHHWPEPEKALKEFYRVLKSGGQFMLFDLRRDMPTLLYPAVWLFQRYFMPEVLRRANGALGSIWSSFTPDELKDLLSSSPFASWNIKTRLAWLYIYGKKGSNQ